MQIDVIIPTLNESRNLRKLLDYLCSSIDNKQVQLIVVDAAHSSDNTQQICRNYDVLYLKSKHTRRSIQMNEGAKKAKGDVLMFLHADVFPPENYYDLIQKTFQEVDCGFFSYKFNSQRPLLQMNSFFTRFDGIFTGGGDQCLFIKRPVFSQLKGFDDECPFMEDFDFFDKLKSKQVSYKIVNSPALVSARKYENHSYLRVNLANLITFAKYRMGYDRSELEKTYRKWLIRK